MAETESKKANWFARHKVLSVILGVILLIIIASAGSSSNNSNSKSVPAASDKPQTTKSTTKPAATPQNLLGISGSGTKQTQKFTAAGDWDLNWTYDCSGFGTQGNFIVEVYNGDGSISFENQGVNQLGASGSDVQHFHKGGTFYLSVNSECKWTINVKG